MSGYLIQLSPDERRRADEARLGIIRPQKIAKVPEPRLPPVTRTEVCRSFAYKLNAGPGTFESRDFFCSQKAECAIEDASEVSAALFAFCKKEVLQSVRQYIRDMNQQRANQPKTA